jgi:gentisate 1,2-dioxygenase
VTLAEAVAAVRMAELGPQRAASPDSAAQERARYFNSANAFNITLPAVPARSFTEPAARALAAGAPTGYHACDQSQALAMATPATTPLMLARYARIAAGESLLADFVASGSIWYVIAGAGRSRAGDAVRWSAGDVLYFPGGEPVRHTAGAEGAVLWVVTDEPLLALDGLRPGALASRQAHGQAVHYPAPEIARQLLLVEEAIAEPSTSGRAVVFSQQALEAGRNILPLLTLSLNTLPPGAAQRPHRHNSAAVTLVIQGSGCHSELAGEPCPWQPWATMVTPPAAAHSHHNLGQRRAEFLIVQDGGLHYHARTMGFEFL